MPFLFEYFLKLSVCLALVYLFYQFVLRRLTFYNWNRWYLLGYTALSFVLVLVNITPSLERSELMNNEVIKFIPSLALPVVNEREAGNVLAGADVHWSNWNWLLLFLLSGMGLLLLRLLALYYSFRKIRNQATLLSDGDMKLYHVDKDIIPFSFGNSIFVNRRMHDETELQEIIRHEFVHVKQRHSQDILWSELLCIINWYNPFAWLIRKAIRQNLEFIADNKVVEHGIDKKQYQYLLLKVVGNNHYSIANQFNFSSLKKRIAMMNKMKSARMHLFKFLFILPLLAVMLLAFREKRKAESMPAKKMVAVSGLVVDAVTREPVSFAAISCPEKNVTVSTDEKGYFLIKLPNGEDKEFQFNLLIRKKGYEEWHQHEHWANLYKDQMYAAFGNTFEFFGLQKEGQKEQGFSFIGGNARDIGGLNYERALSRFNRVSNNPADRMYIIDTPPLPPPPPPVPAPPGKLPKHVSSIDVNNGQADVLLKDGTKERYNLNNADEKAVFEKKYGKLPAPPPPPVPANAPAQPPRPAVSVSEVNVTGVSIQSPVHVTTTTSKGLGDVYVTGTVTTVNPVMKVIASPSLYRVNSTNTEITYNPAATTVSGVSSAVSVNPRIYNSTGLTFTGNRDHNAEVIMELKIFKSTTQQKLDNLIAEAKEKGVDLIFDKIKFSGNDLTALSCTVKKDKSKSSFSASDFEIVNIQILKNDKGYYFRIMVNEHGEEL